MNPDLRNLVALQDIELKIVDIQKQISEIPRKTEDLESDLARLKQEHESRIAHTQEIGRQRRAREGEVEMMNSKLSRLKEQLMAVKTNKEYTAMLHEIQMAEAQIRAAEDGILDLMEETETMEKELSAATAELKSKTSAIENEIRNARELIPQLEAEAAGLQEQKGDIERQIGGELLERYRRIAEARKGVALAEARDELCSACHVRIRPQVYADLLRTDQIFVCDSCSRILFVREAL